LPAQFDFPHLESAAGSSTECCGLFVPSDGAGHRAYQHAIHPQSSRQHEDHKERPPSYGILKPEESRDLDTARAHLRAADLLLRNLAARPLDTSLAELASSVGLVYTRYADDLTFSALEYPESRAVSRIHSDITQTIWKHGFRVNNKKTRLARAGCRKMVLGLLVDGDEPRVPRWTVIRIDRFLHAIEKFGLESVARHHRFDSAFGFYNHLQGLVAYLKDVDPHRWPDFKARLDSVTLPWDISAI
jgi:hypothetical protein